MREYLGPVKAAEVLVQQYDLRTGIWSTSPLQARPVDGRMADIVVLSKLAQVIVPGVCKIR
jgi:hypothetical protein